MEYYSLYIACSPYNTSDRRNIRVQIKCLASETDGIENEEGAAAIFAYRRIGANPEKYEYVFDHVCSTVDMVEYPLMNNLQNGESFKWCRSDVIDILVRTLSIADDFIAEVKSDVELLYRNMQIHNEDTGVASYSTVYTVGEGETISVNQNGDAVLVASFPLAKDYGIIQPKNGVVSVVRDEDTSTTKLYYKPNVNVFGTDSFMYYILNMDSDPVASQVTININKAYNIASSQILEEPVSGPTEITYTTPSINPAIADCLDGDPSTWETVQYSAVSDNNGTVSLNNNILTYTPAIEFTGPDSITYTVTDGKKYVTVLCQMEVVNG